MRLVFHPSKFRPPPPGWLATGLQSVYSLGGQDIYDVLFACKPIMDPLFKKPVSAPGLEGGTGREGGGLGWGLGGRDWEGRKGSGWEE